MSFATKKRREYLQKMANEPLDLLIIGGGITGAGIALDASLRNMKVGLVEMQDFAAGTSSRSTKLIHGGLRYLKQMEVQIVAEVGRERAIVYENAPHVTTPEWMMLPFYQGGTFGKFSTSIGLKLYDFLAGVKKSERRYMLNKEQTLEKETLLKPEGLIGSGVYVEYKTDDARLTLEVMKEAAVNGALITNYSKMEQFIVKGGKVIGVKVHDLLNHEYYQIYAKKIVNATGPWVDQLREMDGSKKEKRLLLTKGAHLVFDQSRFPLHHAVYFDTNDKRMIFAIPRDGKTYLGTTDTIYNGDIQKPEVTDEDRNYLLNAVNYLFPTLKLTREDIESSWAGLRALVHEEGKPPSEISRRDEIFISSSGLVSIAGGKLTGYRKMAENVVNIIIQQLQLEEDVPFIQSVTKRKTLSGGDVGGSAGYPNFIEKKVKAGECLGLDNAECKRLVKHYGSNIDKVYNIIRNMEFKITKRYQLSKEIYGALVYGMEEEMVATPMDFFLRRTGALLFDKEWVISWKEPIVQYMADYFNWTKEETNYYIQELEEELL